MVHCVFIRLEPDALLLQSCGQDQVLSSFGVLRLILVGYTVQILCRLQVLHEVLLLVIVVALLFRWLLRELNELSHFRLCHLDQEGC